MKRAMSGTAVSLAVMSVAGLALAAGPQPGRVGAAPTGNAPAGNAIVAQASPMQPGAPAAGAGTGTKAPPSTAQPATPPPTIVGKDLVNTKGQKIGKIAKIDGNQVVLSVGGFLGIGAHEVAVPWNSLTTMGSGAKLKVETAMTEDELKQLPAYKDSGAGDSGVRAMHPSNGGMTSSPSR